MKKSQLVNRRKSTKEKDEPTMMTPSNRNTWSASRTNNQNSPSRRPQLYGQESQNMLTDRPWDKDHAGQLRELHAEIVRTAVCLVGTDNPAAVAWIYL